MIKKVVSLNGAIKTLVTDPEATLADVIRKQLKLTGTKIGCCNGQCGACSVIMNEKVVRSCVTKMKRVPEGAVITTIEGIGTPDNLHALQLAWTVHGGAQCGFCSPGFIVSAKGLLDQNLEPTRDDVRDWFQKHRNACRCTGYKPLVDAVMDAARVLRGEITMEELAYKLPADGKIWGSKYPRPSAVAKVTGTGEYGADLGLKLPSGTLQLKLVQANVSHANILFIDTSEAEKMPGVYRVLTHKDVKGKNRITGLITFPTNKGDGWDRPILCDTKVFQFGDTIAIVCADTEEHAQAAVEKVKVELELLPPYMNAIDAMADDAIEIHPGTPNVYFEQKIAKGEDTAPIMEKADYVVEGSFYLQRQPHLPIEPDVGLAYFDEEDRLAIHSKSIALNFNAAQIAAGIGIELPKLRMVQNPSGGNFGYKFSPTVEALLGVAALATGKPVFLNYSYYQQITYTGKRSPFFIDLKYGADKDGKILAMESQWVVDHGPYSEAGDLLTLKGAQFIGAGYGIPNIRGLGRTVCTNHAWGSPFRSFGSPQSFFASESLMDMLAEKMGVDPLELRYKNVYRAGDTTPSGCSPDVFVLPELIDMIRPKYKEALERAKKESTDDKKRGVGVSIGIYGCGLDGPDGAEAWAELTPEGVTISTIWHETGQGADMGCLATAHESLRPLGIKPEQIKLNMNDTARVPDGGPAGGSRSQVIVGNAIKASCDLLVEAMKKADGSYRTYDEMVAEGIPLKHVGKWAAPCTNCDENGQGNPLPNYMYGVFLAEVEVNVKTGETQVVKMTLAADVGKIANKLVVDGQMYGGLAQGIGLALSENFEDLNKHTTMVACGFPYIKDIPDALELMYLETPRILGPHGAAGAGEVPLTSPHVAIINAIYNACGVRISQLPALPEKVLAGLQSKCGK
ncbi:molybdopterin-dependent aldehyde oxidoreductase [Desulfoscipio gibsoniae]|uniref:Aerobic-type carbon monoxide dehydrogenase, large subunit CoxL/CutL-like protein n=1 Tax=Desulfoscipio gibsoniae DSM 7213 TaxID=767817 RepID=R4KRT5_9FIRM|nr:molybdopterin-dependent aldehyde oxidoreductase [Desulfoscipio gibsoniae]AGL02316.1 aerobic-type carbon monoxide dehydrogenase, large subunit CoxL/CutL-like protein [Desulfoscipio gibsoniae DSM 7213]